ncbi:MAG: UTP--glucose-1-phosphate uridylyltransferase GalU [Firmicutes bacterium]|nr:UTP--glucose-1-phosphate uridylyltransferase GalU [Bacillota bacterium]
MEPVHKAVIPAAGFGTRFLPATKALPKEMLPIVDKPAIQYIVEEAIASGIDSIIIVTGRNKRAIEDHFDRSAELEIELKEKGKQEQLRLIQEISEMVDVQYVRQKVPHGLGDAIYCARNFVGDEPFAVLLGDDIVYNPQRPALRQLLDAYERSGRSVIGVQEVPRTQVSRYGIVAAGQAEGRLYTVRDLVEKPSPEEAPSQLAIMGRYVLTPHLFDVLERTTPDAGGEIQLTDALRLLAEDEMLYAYYFEGRRYDIGDKLGYLQATVEFALRHPELSAPFAQYLQELVQQLNDAGEYAAS